MSITHDYISELEQDLEFACNVSKGRAEEILKLEAEKAELVDDLKFIAEQEDSQYIIDILKKYGVTL